MRRNKAMNGLKHCASGLGCYGCPYSEGHKATPSCQLENSRDALKVIEEQKKQIQELKKRNNYLQSKTKDQMELIEAYKTGVRWEKRT